MKTLENLIKFCLLFLTLSITAQKNIEGKWKTVDESTGETTSVVEIYSFEGKLYGRIAKLFNETDEQSLCDTCTGEDKGKPLLGLNILKNLKQSGKSYQGGKIFDPSNGKEYRCKIWLDEFDSDKIYVRGYWGIFYRTQNWYRYRE